MLAEITGMVNSAGKRGRDFRKGFRKARKKSGKRATTSNRQLPCSFYQRLFASEDSLTSRFCSAFFDQLQTIPEKIWTIPQVAECLNQETEIQDGTPEVFE